MIEKLPSIVYQLKLVCRSIDKGNMERLVISEEKLLEKIRQLPLEKVTEVENFVDFLIQQNQNSIRQTNWSKEIAAMANDPEIQAEITAIDAEFAIAELLEPVLLKIWDNPADADYDEL